MVQKKFTVCKSWFVHVHPAKMAKRIVTIDALKMLHAIFTESKGARVHLGVFGIVEYKAVILGTKFKPIITYLFVSTVTKKDIDAAEA